MESLRKKWIPGTLYALGLALAGADFEGIPWANMAGILMLIMVAMVAARGGIKFPMRRTCAWCGRFLGWTQCRYPGKTTHCMCPSCQADLMTEAETCKQVRPGPWR